MRKADNISKRIQWLKAMLADKIATADVDPVHLKNAKEFCGMALDGYFVAISYNTVKAYFSNSPRDEFGSHPYPNNLEYFLELRRQVYECLVEINHVPTQKTIEDVDWKRMYRNALWQSNLCSTAYLALRRELQAILIAGAEDSKLDYRKLKKVVARSESTYMKIISQDPEPGTLELTIIAGGKK